MGFFQVNAFVLLDKYIKLLKIQGAGFYDTGNAKGNIMCIAIKWHINDLHWFQYGTGEAKKPLNDNLQQRFGK